MRENKDEQVAADAVAADLRQSMAEELQAAQVYSVRAGKPGAPAQVYLHAAKEETEHHKEFERALAGWQPVAGADLKVRVVGKDILHDYKGMNPAFARIIEFKDIADDELLVLDAKDAETINHERRENDDINAGMAYWPAHVKLMEQEEKSMKFKDAKVMAVKFVDEDLGIIEGINMPFGGPLKGKDLQGEYFSQRTDACENWFKTRPILYHHGLDDTIKAIVIGHDTATKVLDNGRWIQAQLDKSMAYWKELAQLIKQGKVFFSSGAVPHLVEKAVDGELLRWPWVETSLTVSPANPLAMINSMKAMEDLKAIGATDAELTAIKPPATANENKEAQNMATKAKVKTVKLTCKFCQKEGDYEVPCDEADPAAGKTEMPPAAGTPAPVAPDAGAPKPAGDTQPPATNPGVGQGMGAETHVASAGIEAEGQSGQHSGSTPAPEKPRGDTTPPPGKDTVPAAGKGETPKPAAATVQKEPEPPAATTQAVDNVVSSTAAPPAKAEKAAEPGKDIPQDAAIKAAQERKETIEGIKAAMADALKGVSDRVKEALTPLEGRIKALENMPAETGPIRRVANPANPAPESTAESKRIKAMMDDPHTPADVKKYIGEQLAADEMKDIYNAGPVPLRKQ